MKSFQTLSSLFQSFSQNTSNTNKLLGEQMINDAHRYLLQKYFDNEFTSTALTVSQQQDYDLPANYSKMKSVTITIGTLKWTLTEILTRREWDELNVFPYYADIPVNYFIYNGKVNIWPIPSTADNTITYNYKIRVPDLTFNDYTTGTVTMTENSKAVVGDGTGWLANYLSAAGSVANLNLWLKPTAPKGDNNWYQIASIASATALTLRNVYPSTNETATLIPHTIGQMPLIMEDFHDLLVYRPLMIYFSSINPDKVKAQQFRDLYTEGEERLAEYSGQKSVDVNLGRRPQHMNPNLFPQNLT
jgi:hypothetical protein